MGAWVTAPDVAQKAEDGVEGHGRGDGDADDGFLCAAEAEGGGFKGADLVQHAGGLAEEDLTLGGQTGPVFIAGEEIEAQLILELADLMADGGLDLV